MNAIETLAKFAHTAQPDPALNTIAVPAIADCFGCILAGAHSQVAARVTAAIEPFTTGSAPLYGTQSCAFAPAAGMINAVAGHAWDLDDWEEPGNTHPTVVMLPALLAASTIRKTSGSELLAAYAVGTEVIMRLGEAMSLQHYARGFHSTATLGAIGAAAAVARLLQLTTAQTENALSLATSQAIGYTLQFGSNAKPLQAGWAARNGLEAALFAQAGVTAQSQIIDHERGFAGLLTNYDANRFQKSLTKIGKPWALLQYGLVLKPWPSCGYTHRLMTAALAAREHIKGDVSQIASIEARLPDFHAAILPFGNPTSRAEALFSAQACIAQILTAGNLTLDDSEAEFWKSPDVACLIAKTEVIADPAKRPWMNYDPDQPDELLIRLTSGEVLVQECAYPLGAAQNPMTTAQLRDKFTNLTGKTNAQFEQLLNWPDVDDVANFFQGMAE